MKERNLSPSPIISFTLPYTIPVHIYMYYLATAREQRVIQVTGAEILKVESRSFKRGVKCWQMPGHERE